MLMLFTSGIRTPSTGTRGGNVNSRCRFNAVCVTKQDYEIEK